MILSARATELLAMWQRQQAIVKTCDDATATQHARVDLLILKEEVERQVRADIKTIMVSDCLGRADR